MKTNTVQKTALNMVTAIPILVNVNVMISGKEKIVQKRSVQRTALKMEFAKMEYVNALKDGLEKVATTKNVLLIAQIMEYV